MKIATQNLVLIVPIFLLLALVTSLLVFVSEQREVRWGLESEAESLALTIAEFTDLTSLAMAVAADPRAVGPASFQEPLDRVLAFGQARRIDIAAIEGTHLRPLLGAGERQGDRPAIDEQVLGRLLQGEVVIAGVPATTRLVAHAPVRDVLGALQGVVSVETSLAPVAAHRTAVLRRSASILLALLLVGSLVALVVSTVITREIGRLTRTARAFAAGDYTARLVPGAIEEVAVVGATFGIMGSVLEDSRRRSTREMLQFDRFDTEATLAEFHAERFSAAIVAEHAGVSLAIDRLGPAVHGDFWFAEGDARRGHACLGRLDGAASFEVVLAASAASTLLQGRVSRGEGAADALLEAAELFPIHCCVLVEWDADTRGTATVHRLEPEGTVSRDTLRLEPTRTAALTTLDPGDDRRAVRYAYAHVFDTPRRLVDELRQLSGTSTHGSVLALQVMSS